MTPTCLGNGCTGCRVGGAELLHPFTQDDKEYMRKKGILYFVSVTFCLTLNWTNFIFEKFFHIKSGWQCFLISGISEKDNIKVVQTMHRKNVICHIMKTPVITSDMLWCAFWKLLEIISTLLVQIFWLHKRARRQTIQFMAVIITFVVHTKFLFPQVSVMRSLTEQSCLKLLC